MQVIIYIHPKAALLAGKNEHGNKIFDVDPAQLTVEEREELVLRRSYQQYGSGEYPWVANEDRLADQDLPQVAEASLDTLRVILQARIARRKAEAEAVEAARKQAIAYFLARPPEGFFNERERALLVRPELDKIPIRPRTDDEKDATAAHMAKIQEFLCALTARYEAAERDRAAAKKAREEGERAEKKRAAREKEEEAERKEAQLTAWVREDGTESQRARHAEGLLAEDEIIDCIREQAFAPLSEWPRYEKIKRGDMCTCEEAWNCSINCETYDAASASDEEYNALVRMRSLVPSAGVTLRTHECTTSQCGETIQRPALRVKIVVGTLTLSREYAVTH